VKKLSVLSLVAVLVLGLSVAALANVSNRQDDIDVTVDILPHVIASFPQSMRVTVDRLFEDWTKNQTEEFFSITANCKFNIAFSWSGFENIDEEVREVFEHSLVYDTFMKESSDPSSWDKSYKLGQRRGNANGVDKDFDPGKYDGRILLGVNTNEWKEHAWWKLVAGQYDHIITVTIAAI
jgi:hypothetical protein